MISCQDADVLSAALSVGSLNGEDETALQQHLAECADCRRVAAEYMAAAARLPLALEPATPSPELRGRLMRAVYAEAATAGRTARVRRAVWWRRIWARMPASRGWTVVAAAAAVAMFGFATWAGVNRQTAAPKSVSVALVATSAAPEAHGQLTYDSGSNQAVLTASGLPSPAAAARRGAVYQIWLIQANRVAVPVGFLSQGPDGTWIAAIHTDVSAYTSIAATVEPPGGSPQPTGAIVIRGSLRGS